MQMDIGLDTGPMLLRRALPIATDDTTGTLHDKLARLGAEVIVEALPGLAAGTLHPVAQVESDATYARKISRAEGALDWRRPAEELARAVRAFDPFPGAFGHVRDTAIKLWAARTLHGHGEPGVVLRADAQGVAVACGTDALLIGQLQRPGSRRMAAADFLRGFPLAAGERFTLPGA